MTRQYTSREFDADVDSAKRATGEGPVIITDQGEPAHVLLSIGEYRRLVDRRGSLVDQLSSDDTIDIDFQADRHLDMGVRAIDLD